MRLHAHGHVVSIGGGHGINVLGHDTVYELCGYSLCTAKLRRVLDTRLRLTHGIRRAAAVLKPVVWSPSGSAYDTFWSQVAWQGLTRCRMEHRDKRPLACSPRSTRQPGKHLGQDLGEVADKDPAYCQWILRTAEAHYSKLLPRSARIVIM